MNPTNTKTLKLKNSALWIVAILLLVMYTFMTDDSPGMLLVIAVASLFVLMLSSNAILSSAVKGAHSESGDAPTDPIA